MGHQDQEHAHEKLQFFVKNIHTIKQLFKEDVDIAIADREKVLEHILSKEIDVESSKGRVLRSDEPMAEAIRLDKRMSLEIPKDAYGTPFTAVLVPLHNDNKEVIGAISVSRSTANQMILKEVSEQFAASSEEISASTEELAVSATDFNNYMKQLSEAQNDMQKEVEATAKILELINAVAKSTRVLGFNAGIEAARAGEYGRGFTVVAREITRLAEQSADSVNEINQLLAELKEKVGNVANIVENTIKISTRQTKAIEEISAAIEHLAEGAEEIEEMAKKV